MFDKNDFDYNCCHLDLFFIILLLWFIYTFIFSILELDSQNNTLQVWGQ